MPPNDKLILAISQLKTSLRALRGCRHSDELAFVLFGRIAFDTAAPLPKIPAAYDPQIRLLAQLLQNICEIPGGTGQAYGAIGELTLGFHRLPDLEEDETSPAPRAKINNTDDAFSSPLDRPLFPDSPRVLRLPAVGNTAEYGTESPPSNIPRKKPAADQTQSLFSMPIGLSGPKDIFCDSPISPVRRPSPTPPPSQRNIPRFSRPFPSFSRPPLSPLSKRKRVLQPPPKMKPLKRVARMKASSPKRYHNPTNS